MQVKCVSCHFIICFYGAKKYYLYTYYYLYFYIYILFLLTAYDIELPPKCKVGPLISDQKHVFWRRFLRKCIYVKTYYIIIILLYISFKTWTLWILVGQWTTISTQAYKINKWHFVVDHSSTNSLLLLSFLEKKHGKCFPILKNRENN